MSCPSVPMMIRSYTGRALKTETIFRFQNGYSRRTASTVSGRNLQRCACSSPPRTFILLSQSRRAGRAYPGRPSKKRQGREVMELNEKLKELVAVGASVTANCQPCLQHHVEKAL